MKIKHDHKINLILIVSLVAVISVSGCVGAEFFDGIFGKVGDVFGLDVIKPSTQVTQIGETNPLSINKVWTLPENKVLPESSLNVYMEFSNRDNDPSKQIEAVVDIFDATVFKGRAGKYCNSYSNPKSADECGPVDGSCVAGSYIEPEAPLDTGESKDIAKDMAVAAVIGGANSLTEANPCTIKIGATKQVSFDLFAPTADEIANVITKAKINYKVNYKYDGGTNFEILVVDYNEIISRQKDGKTLSTNLIDTRGSGPIKIEQAVATPYIISSVPSGTSGTATNAYITFKLRNAGSGTLKGSKIQPGTLQIEFPADLGDKVCIPGTKKLICSEDDLESGKNTAQFKCDSPDNGVIKCANAIDIEFFRTESEPFQFVVKNIKPLPAGTPFRTFMIKSTVSYLYELRGTAEVTVNPIINP